MTVSDKLINDYLSKKEYQNEDIQNVTVFALDV